MVFLKSVGFGTDEREEVDVLRRGLERVRTPISIENGTTGFIIRRLLLSFQVGTPH